MYSATPFPEPEIIHLPDTDLAVYTAGPQDGYPVICVHGWPELAYSWKSQIDPLTRAGYRVIAFDVRGFGRSSIPHGDEHYQISNLVADIDGLIAHFGLKHVAVCGHDWGGIIVWHAARMLREKISHVISLCTPHTRRPPADPITIFRKRHGDEHYFVRFNDSADAHSLFERDIDAFFRLLFRSTPDTARPSANMFNIPHTYDAYLNAGAPELGGQVMSAQDRAVYVKAYARSGFHGGVNLYRNTTANWHLSRGLSDRISQPTLMISAQNDLFLPPALTEPMVDMVPDLERRTIAQCGHWMMWDKPDQLSALLLDWLSRRI